MVWILLRPFGLKARVRLEHTSKRSWQLFAFYASEAAPNSLHRVELCKASALGVTSQGECLLSSAWVESRQCRLRVCHAGCVCVKPGLLAGWTSRRVVSAQYRVGLQSLNPQPQILHSKFKTSAEPSLSFKVHSLIKPCDTQTFNPSA